MIRNHVKSAWLMVGHNNAANARPSLHTPQFVRMASTSSASRIYACDSQQNEYARLWREVGPPRNFGKERMDLEYLLGNTKSLVKRKIQSELKRDVNKWQDIEPEIENVARQLKEFQENVVKQIELGKRLESVWMEVSHRLNTKRNDVDEDHGEEKRVKQRNSRDDAEISDQQQARRDYSECAQKNVRHHEKLKAWIANFPDCLELDAIAREPKRHIPLCVNQHVPSPPDVVSVDQPPSPLSDTDDEPLPKIYQRCPSRHVKDAENVLSRSDFVATSAKTVKTDLNTTSDQGETSTIATAVESGHNASNAHRNELTILTKPLPSFPTAPPNGQKHESDVAEFEKRLIVYCRHIQLEDPEDEAATTIAEYRKVVLSKASPILNEVKSDFSILDGAFGCEDDVRLLSRRIGSFFLLGSHQSAVKVLQRIFDIVKDHSPAYLSLEKRSEDILESWQEISEKTERTQLRCIIYMDSIPPGIAHDTQSGDRLGKLLSGSKSADSMGQDVCVFVLCGTSESRRDLRSWLSPVRSTILINVEEKFFDFEEPKSQMVLARNPPLYRVLLCSLLSRRGCRLTPVLHIARPNLCEEVIPLRNVISHYLTEHELNGYKPYLLDNTLKALAASYPTRKHDLKFVYDWMLMKKKENNRELKQEMLTVAMAFAFSLFLEYRHPHIINGPVFW